MALARGERKMRRYLLFVSCFFVVSITAHAQLPPSQECYALGEVARSISAARASGVTKQQMLDGIKVMISQTRALWSEPFTTEATELVDEVYAYGVLDPTAYAAYRSELCQIFRASGQAEVPFEEAYLDLLMCSRFASDAELRKCGVEIADSYARADVEAKGAND